ncbi:unnamed protein product [Candida verbasci]|uniref:Protein OCA4 n=1 Tax=Candida verbasci TaxID=1227364 RepID=A0A9W4TRP2_9ASCO|nr:unnamed protein product [Candida verbasci]
MLVTPENFGLVEPGIYRSSKLDSDNFPFLETLNLKSIVILDAEKPPRSLNNFLEQNKVDYYNLGGLKISNHHHTGISSKTDDDEEEDSGSTVSDSTTKSDKSSNFIDIISLNRNNKDQWMLIEKNLIIKTFEILLNKNKFPLLVIDSTSTLCGILRKIQKWNFNSILNEYRIYSNTSNKNNNYFAETFLELIQIELIPYEKRKEEPVMNKSPSMSRRASIRSMRQNSIDTITGDDNAMEDDFDDMDEIDDDLLSASPQIPANLLKLVEQRKQNKRDESSAIDTSPKLIANSRNNSFSNNDSYLSLNRSSMDRRRSSIEFMKNIKFRHNSVPKFESTSPNFRRRDSRIDEKNDYKYYKNLNKNPIQFENVNEHMGKELYFVK